MGFEGSELCRTKRILESRLQLLAKYIKDNCECDESAQTSIVGATGNPCTTIKKRYASLNREHSRRYMDPVDLLSLSETIGNGASLVVDQAKLLRSLIEKEIDLLSDGLRGRSSSSTHYPANLTVGNFCDFITLPTLIYELEYPRTERIDWLYVLEKTAATFGTIGLMIVISQNWIYPVVMSTLRMKDELTLQQRLREFPWVLSGLLFPFMVEYLLAFYVIWECVVSAFLLSPPVPRCLG